MARHLDPISRHDLTLTPPERAAIADTLADPANAWRAEPEARKRAHAELRDAGLPPGADAATVDKALERLLGGDDMVLSGWLTQGERAARTVALIRTPLGTATGFLISDWLLLTNHHALGSADEAAASEALFGYAEDENGAIASVRVRFDPDRCFVTGGGGDLDFSIVALEPLRDGTAPGARFGHVPLIGTVGKILVGQPVNIVQHPGGASRRVAFRNSRLLSVSDERRVEYDGDTAGGSSGAPVFSDQWNLVALHYTSVDATNADGLPIDVNGEPVTPQTPERLRHWVANAGVRISYLVSYLRTADLDPTTKPLIDEVLGPV